MSNLNIVLRSVKGSALTFDELDANFTNLIQASNTANNAIDGSGGVLLQVADTDSESDAQIQLTKFVNGSSVQKSVLTALDLDAENVATPNGTGSISYDSSLGRYSYTPPDLTSFLTSSSAIQSSQLPAIAITSVQTAADQAAQLALTTQEGDVVVRTDESKSYVRNNGTADPHDMSNFTLLQTPDADTTYGLTISQTGSGDDSVLNNNPILKLDPSNGTDIDITLTGGTNTTVTRVSDTEVSIASTDTWQANAIDTDGYVTAPTASDVNQVWKTDASGNPDWRDDAGTTYAFTVESGLTSLPTISSMSSGSNPSITFSVSHGLSSGDIVRVVDTSGDMTNGDYAVSVNSATNFIITGSNSATDISTVTLFKVDNDDASLLLAGTNGTTDEITITGGNNVTVSRNSDTQLTISSSDQDQIGSANGILKADGNGAVSAAVASTDYIGATTGSAIQKADGSGGLTGATEGTDYNSPDKIGARFRLPSGNNSVVGTQKIIEIATINITGVGESYKASFVTNTTDYTDNTTITETTHISIRQTDAFGSNPEIYLSTETSRKDGDLGVFCNTRKTSVTSPSNLSQVKLFVVLSSTGDVGAEGFVTSETVSDSTKVSATWETSFAETDYLGYSDWGSSGGTGEIGDDVYLHTTRSERWNDLFGNTAGITVTDGGDTNPIDVIANGTGFLKNDGSGNYSYDNSTYHPTATPVRNQLLIIGGGANNLNPGDKTYKKAAEIDITTQYQNYSVFLSAISSEAGAEDEARPTLASIRVYYGDNGAEVDIDTYHYGTAAVDFGYVISSSSSPVTVDIYTRVDGASQGAMLHFIAEREDGASVDVTWGQLGASSTTAPTNFVQGGVYETWHSGNQAGIFGTTNGILKANGSGVLSAAVAGTDYSTLALGTDSTTAMAGDTALSAIGGSLDLSSQVTGTLPVGNMAATALTTVQTAADQAAQLALTTEEGDVVVRTDENKTYMRNSGTADPHDMTNFTLLATPTDSVTSVDGNTGAVTTLQIGTTSTTALAGDTSLLQLGTTGTTALAGNTTSFGGSASPISLGQSTTGSQTVDIASATNTGSKIATVNIAQGGGTRTVNIASDNVTGSTTVVYAGNPSATASSTILLRGNLSIDRPMYGPGATEYYDFYDHLGSMFTTNSDGDWDISGTGLNALTEITIPATSHIGNLGKRGSLRMTCHSIFYNSSSTTKRNAEYYLGLQMRSKGASNQSQNLGAATLVSSPSQFNGVWSFAGNVTDKIVAGFGSLANSNSASGMYYGPAPILGIIYDDTANKTYIRVSSYYYYNSLGGTPLSNGQTTSFDVYYNPTEFKSSGTWVSSMRADSFGSRNRMTVQPQSYHQMHHAFNLSLPKETSKTELRLIFDYSGSNTDLAASVHAIEGTVMLEGSRV